ncbi:uncharacterized protein LOC126416241 [Schistocerca serialis cubense]|uniref:uncharacterized protein LOC126416241 n=1 Tax=Schistocerca serialis cubense TaxID=2023355 RepID=UPI00214E0A0C|nr:uncharacterized protein LOC126416241 [Schistocerca serialis cubense]
MQVRCIVLRTKIEILHSVLCSGVWTLPMHEKRRKSYLWGFFTVQKSDGANKFAQCGICDRTLRFTTSVTNLRKHLERKHPTSLSLCRQRTTAASSAISRAVSDDIDHGVNGQDDQQSVYSSTHIVHYQSHEPIEHSSKVETSKDTASESETSTSMFEITDDRTMPSVSASSAVLSSVGTKRKWREFKNDRHLSGPREQFSSPLKENDEFDLFGMSIAAKMRKMSRTNDIQCIIAEKLISEVVYHGQLKSLTFDTVIKVSEKDIN